MNLDAGGPEEDACIGDVGDARGLATLAFTCGAAAVEREA
jgi:hypothetical protein